MTSDIFTLCQARFIVIGNFVFNFNTIAIQY